MNSEGRNNQDSTKIAKPLTEVVTHHETEATGRVGHPGRQSALAVVKSEPGPDWVQPCLSPIVTVPEITLQQAIRDYRTWLQKTPDVAKSTKLAYQADVVNFLSSVSNPQAVQLKDVDERDVERWKSTMTNLSSSTVRRRLIALSNFFGWARMQKLVELDPVEFVKKPPKARQVRPSVSLEHYRMLEAVCENASQKARLGCLYWGGCRRQEVCDLNIGSVDLTTMNLLVTGKGGHQRLVPILGELKTLLKKHLSTRPGAAHDAPLFLNRDSNRISLNTVNRWFKGLCRKAGLQDCDYTPHACRAAVPLCSTRTAFPHSTSGIS